VNTGEEFFVEGIDLRDVLLRRHASDEAHELGKRR
jgi:hypothetical protein